VLGIFRTNQLVVYLLALLYMAVLWVPVFVHTPLMRSHTEGYIYRVVYGWLPDAAGWRLLLAMMLIWIQGLVLTRLVLHYRMGMYATLFPGLMLVWTYSLMPEAMDFLPVILANTFLIFAWQALFSVYRSHDAATSLFNAGFLVGLAGLSYFPMMVMGIAGIIGLQVLRSVQMREMLQYLIGVGLPWFFLFVFYEYMAMDGSFAALAGIRAQWPLQFAGYMGARIPIQLAMLAVLVFYLLSQSGRLSHGETMQSQKYLSMAWWFFLLGGLTLPLAGIVSVDHLLVLALPMGLFLGLWLARLPARWAESIHFVLFAAVLIYQYFPLVYL
jgi:hypothetical protein